ncbi:MAG: hypothetical protein IJ880_03330 [Bacilli bacterium]|nr:hypothetical protein [Bacilli bacterium]
MNWFRCTGGNSGGGGGGDELFDVVVDWSWYSHNEQFVDILLPENYSDYDRLAMTVIYTNYATAENAYLLNKLLKYGLDNGSVSNVFLLVNTADISASTSNIIIPMIPGNVCGFVYGTTGYSNINTTRIKGYSYPWGWGNYKCIVFGIKD